MASSVDDIKVLEGLEPIRARPAMYVGPLDDRALPARLLVQGLCHALDQVVAGACPRVDVGVGKGGVASIEYSAGMPVEPKLGYSDVPAAHVLLTVLYACRDLPRPRGANPEACSVGLPVLNALCDRLTVTTRNSGRMCRLTYKHGALSEPITCGTTASADHTRIELRLDAEVLNGNVDLTPATVQDQLVQIYEAMPCLREAVVVAELGQQGN